jgi:2-C-methyl-D-erythritol 4-phosphate cytidylyltransferase/2-C-methyl-D-erythritol 2,4-cyclodiphosphate synthase
MQNAVIIVAAGRGIRASSAGDKPKQYLPLGKRAVLTRSLDAFLGHSAIEIVQAVIDPAHRAFYEEATAKLACAKLVAPVSGGRNRQQSVLYGLRALKSHAPKTVLIHDAARPFVSQSIISHAIDALKDYSACLAALPLSDTLKAESSGLVVKTISRDGLWRAQTPQGFHFDAILAAHEEAERQGRDDFTDDAALAEWQGLDVALIMGSERNIKLTTAEDFELGTRLLEDGGSARETRTGTGFDVHAFEPGDHLILCGIKIPHGAKLKGHSDADVGLHALTDALLGAIGAGDIGQHFPPSDPKWKGADSAVFLDHTAKLVAEAGGRIMHVDLTLICERPKIGPHRDAMRTRIGEVLKIERDRVSVKATTTEGLGFAGRGEGIAAMASATVELSRKGGSDA